ncbi:IS66-like element accessory protein TnpA [Methylobacterium sp. NMS14P]|uniref:IS66-like element accessory protein TnpA n=1 Tax=Methylobacterium sp. NMS14P TaxID=2894310 RepID=UPI003FCF67BA
MSGPTISPHILLAGTRRSWTREDKRAILDEAESTTASVSSVARRHGLTASLLFRWRREAWDEERATSLPVQPAFVPLALPAPPRSPACDQGLPGCAIEVELADGHRLRAQAWADPALARDLLAALLDR